MLWFLLGLVFASTPIDRIAAVVNEEVIALSEVYELGAQFIQQNNQNDETRRKAELKVLDSLIIRILITQELQRIGLDPTTEEVDQAITNVANANKMDQARLRVEVEKTGISWSQYRREMRDSIRQMKFNQSILQPRITVNEDMLLDAYRRGIADLPKEVDLGAIFLAAPAEEKVADVQQRLSNGEAFAKLAAETDEGGVASENGRMGKFKQGSLRPDLDKVAFSIPVGTVSEPICDQAGCFLLYVFSKSDLSPPSFESQRGKLLDEYYAQRFERELALWSDQAKRRASIDIKLVSPE